MLDIGWTELLIVGVVALVVVGPKDLPKMFRALGEFTGKARAMAREFQRAMESAADDAGVKDVARELRDTTSGRNLRKATGLDEMERDLRDIERDMSFDEKADGKPGSGKADAGKAGKAGKAGTPGDEAGEFDEEGADDLIAAEHDAEAARRKAGGEAREAQRRKRMDSVAEARRKASDIRTRRDGGGEQGGEGKGEGTTAPAKTAARKAAPEKLAAAEGATGPAKAAAPKRKPAAGAKPASGKTASGKATTGKIATGKPATGKAAKGAGASASRTGSAGKPAASPPDDGSAGSG